MPAFQDQAAMDLKIASLEVKVTRLESDKEDGDAAFLHLMQQAASQIAKLTKKVHELEDEIHHLKLSTTGSPPSTPPAPEPASVDLLNLDPADPVPGLVDDDAASVRSAAATEPLTPPQSRLGSFVAEANKRSCRPITGSQELTCQGVSTQKGPPQNTISQAVTPQKVTSQTITPEDTTPHLSAPSFRHPLHPVENDWPKPKLRAQLYDRPERADTSDYWRHGITYSPGLTFLSTRFRVLLSNIPSSASLAEVFSRIRGGAIVSVELLPTVALTGSNTALVRFQQEATALEYDDFLHKHEIKIGGKRLGCDLIPTDTYPLSNPQHRAVYKHGQTRCLEVTRFDTLGVPPERLELDLRQRGESTFTGVERTMMKQDGTLQIFFSSVFYAGRSFATLSSFNKYRGSVTTFLQDPCADSMDELLKYNDGEIIGDNANPVQGETETESRNAAISEGDWREQALVKVTRENVLAHEISLLDIQDEEAGPNGILQAVKTDTAEQQEFDRINGQKNPSEAMSQVLRGDSSPDSIGEPFGDLVIATRFSNSTTSPGLTKSKSAPYSEEPSSGVIVLNEDEINLEDLG